MWNYTVEILKGFWTLLLGMKVTVPHLGRHAITIQYPKEKMEMFEPFRGRLALARELETDKEKCTGCQLCAKACPSACITVTQRKDEEGKRRSEVFEIDMSLCCYCGLCVETCPEDAIVWVRDYEYSVYDKTLLLVNKPTLEGIWRNSRAQERKEKGNEKAA